MSEDFVKDVGNVCAGYGMNNHVYINGRTVNLLSVTSDAKSINEMLHLVHSYVCNNEYVLNKMPVTEIKNIDQYCKCTLFGVPNDIAQDIFDNYPTEGEKTEIGETYIIGLEDRTLMMVRDMGHALTIDIEEDKEKQTAFVKYFIPKVCNFDKVNKLRGINTVNNNGYWLDAYATGMYEAPVEGFGKDMVDFINQVPTDRDIMLSFTTGRREIKEIARMDINENITESEIQNASNVIAGIKKEREDKYL